MLLGRVNPATPDGIDRAIIKAQEAQLAWAKTTFSQRRRVLKTILKYVNLMDLHSRAISPQLMYRSLSYVLNNQETIMRIACLDSGKTQIDASLGEIMMTVEKLKWTIEHGEKALRPERRPTNFLMMYKKNHVRWEPLGVLAACVSWK
jgi:acyl-CoA reductase-like NAD-dependent aldehyde dehydrogenase